jgi:hypothetical protein
LAEPRNLCDTQLMSKGLRDFSKPATAHRDGVFFQHRTAKTVGLSLTLWSALTGVQCGGGGSTSTAAPTATTFTVSQTSVAFPSTPVGTTWIVPGFVNLSNTGTAALSISSIVDSDPADFPETTTCSIGGTLVAGASCAILIQFQPGSAGNLSAQLTITTANGGGTVTVPMSGVGSAAQPRLAVSPASYSFPPTAIGQQVSTTLTMSAIGTASVLISSLSSSNPVEFFVVGLTCPNPGSGQAIAGGTSCGFQFGFRPIGAGPRTALITVTSNGGTGTVLLSGAGTGE